MANIKGDPTKPETLKMPSAVNVPVKDRVWDAEQENYVDIAYLTGIGLQGRPQFGEIWFEKEFNGMLVLSGDKRRDAEMYQYLELTNYNASNPNRVDDSRVIFERVDPAKKAESKRKERNAKRTAINMAAEMSASDVRNFASSMGWDESQDLVVLRDKVEEFAETKPSQFVKQVKNKQNEIKALVNRATKAKAIKFDTKTNSWTWVDSAEVICSVSRGSARVEGLVTFLVENPNGAEVMKSLKTALK